MYLLFRNKDDCWSIGCVIGEIILLDPIFPGNSAVHQLELIFKSLGLNSSILTDFRLKSECLGILRLLCHKLGQSTDVDIFIS